MCITINIKYRERSTQVVHKFLFLADEAVLGCQVIPEHYVPSNKHVQYGQYGQKESKLFMRRDT